MPRYAWMHFHIINFRIATTIGTKSHHWFGRFARIHFDDIIAKHLFFCVDAIYDLEPSSWCARARPLILICWCRMLNWSSVNWTWKHISWMQWFWLVALAAAIGEAFDVSMPFIIASFSNKNPFSNGAKIPRAHSIAIIFDFWSSEFTQFPKSPHNTVWVDIFCSAKSDVWLLFWYDLHYFPWTFFGLHSNSILFEIMRVISLPRAQFQCPHESHSFGLGLHTQ